ncbi:MAG TPA: rubredoxin [Casimicrobiaceae bacterium]|nr:rubredoxin [Casimicrobiaceae bacterium]
MSSFEGSYLGDRARIPATARLECKICWYVYDPVLGDPVWQIPAGTPFKELPPYWTCPVCACEQEQFMVLGDE